MSYIPSNGGFGSPEFTLQRSQMPSDAKDPTLKSLLQSPTGMSQQPPMQTFYYVDVPYGSYAMPPTEAANAGSGMYNGFAGFPGQEQPEPKPPPKQQRKNAKSKAR
ncbi:hypothetical protein AAVH_11824 [Aphelenchoides avenae]|nr:hypothetical protein AAVH_11824 [Aphelenchus avenae]